MAPSPGPVPAGSGLKPASPAPASPASYLNTAFLQGEPTAARVELHCSEARLCVTVTDNGRWVPPSSARAGMGLESMRQRAQELGGHTSTTATEGSGTRVRAWLPLAALPRAA